MQKLPGDGPPIRSFLIITGVVGLDDTPDAFVRLQTDKSQIKILVAPGR